MKRPQADKSLGAPSLPWLLLAGVLVLIMAVLVINTTQSLQQTRKLMTASLKGEGWSFIRNLEGAARAGMRRMGSRQISLQHILEEMVDDPRVISIALFGPEGDLMAWASQDKERPTSETVLRGLPSRVRRRIEEHRILVFLSDDELVVGRPFQPLRRFLKRPDGEMPNWVRRMHPEARDKRGMAMGNHPNMMPPFPDNPPYALVRLSTENLRVVQTEQMQRAVILGSVIFAAAALLTGILWVMASRRGREINRLRQEVDQNQHLAAVGRLAGSVAHEIRNPLSALRGLVQYLAKGSEDDPTRTEYAKTAVSEVDRLERVVSGLLEYTRPREPRLFPLEMGDSLESVMLLMNDDPRAQGVELSLEYPPDLPQVMADPDQIRQVLVNLVINALEAVDGRGRVLISAFAQENHMEVTVRDNGPGLPDDEPEKVFELFYSSKERGTGMGLALSRRIISSHKGELRAANHEDGGALFTFTLPPKEPGNESA